MTNIYFNNEHVVSMQPKKGQHIFRYIIATKEISMLVKVSNVQAKTGELYVVALNEYNAIKKFLKLIKRNPNAGRNPK